MIRFSSIEVLGATVTVNMTLVTIKQVMDGVFNERPYLRSPLGPAMALIESAYLEDLVLAEMLSAIEALKLQITSAKRALEMASKILNMITETAVGAMDLVPVSNGKPLGTGAQAKIAPARTALDSAIEFLNNLEDEVQEQTLKLILKAKEVKAQIESAKVQLMDAIFQASQNIISK